jgi:Protein of unknown function (DUF2905)
MPTGNPWVLHTATAPIRYDPIPLKPMLRWLVVVFLAMILINAFAPFLARLGLGKLPGDLRFKLFGRDWFLPLSSTILLSFVATVIGKLV